MNYLFLVIIGLFPLIASVILYFIDKNTKFKELKPFLKEIIIGCIFGALAIATSEWKIIINEVAINCRDACVLVAGFVFGGYAGIIAGILAGVERALATLWGASAFTQMACSIATIVAGFYAAIIKKFILHNRRPGWIFAFSCTIVIEVLHLTLVILTNLNDPTTAWVIVKGASIPLVFTNALSVLLSIVVIDIVSKEKLHIKLERTDLSLIIQRWLLLAILLAFFSTSAFVYAYQTNLALSDGDETLNIAIKDTEDEMVSATSGEIKNITLNRHVEETGLVIIADQDLNVVSITDGYNYTGVDKSLLDHETNTSFYYELDNVDYYARYDVKDSYYVLALVTKDELIEYRDIAVYINAFMEILVFAILYAMIYELTQRSVINPLDRINNSLDKITTGDLNEEVKVKTSEEFTLLSNDINATVNTLKRYIDEANKRIDDELELAKNIQSSSLPKVFEGNAGHPEFDIYALMNPAKEVGGDFYDFYYDNKESFSILIADVSGKGIPSAMFMMRAKAELKALTEAHHPLNDVFTLGNKILCKGNDANMFITAFQGRINLRTGLMQFVNAGHNPPLIKKKSTGKFEYLKAKSGFVLAGLDNFNYSLNELTLEPGDIVYLYTDGVTEANNTKKELFGEKRLLKELNTMTFDNVEDLSKKVLAKVNKFSVDTKQADDITMLAFQYFGPIKKPTMHLDTVHISDIETITKFVENEMAKIKVPQKTVYQIDVAIDEIVSNIVKYGYENKEGPLDVSVFFNPEKASLYVRFVDNGVPYNPLRYDDPDTSLKAEDRKIGGLGIYIVKKTMDDIRYKYEKEQNILTIVKKI